jgi:asparagine synthase (glutamine-hydrolysing)
MCGIAGIAYPDERQVHPDLLMGMTRAMTHRGPDAEGYFFHDGVGLGHRRLRIIDLSGGVQPMYNEDRTVVVVYNGEIFNFADIKRQLESKGHTFTTHCDTEVIVHAYEEYGRDCPTHFRGMFAFAIYDTRRRRLLLCRDRLGIKPVYYTFTGGTLLFASEVNALLRARGNRASVDGHSLDFYLSLGYVPGAATMFDAVRKLEPGHTLTFANGEIRIDKYWDLVDAPPADLSLEAAQNRLKELLEESIRLRLMSDVPLGAFLSGGLDSSTVVACMAKMIDAPVKTFSVGYADDLDSSELDYARKVSDHLRTEHHEYVLSPDDFFQSLDLLLAHIEEPIVESAAVALYRLATLAREHVTVILSGEGGDEILAGYPLYQIMPKVDRLNAIAGRIPRSVLQMAARALASEKTLKYANWVSTPLHQRYWGISCDVTPWIKKRMYGEALVNGGGDRVRDYFEGLFNTLPNSTPLRRMTYVDLKTWLPDDLLVKADKMTMAASLELRVPLLDHKLLEFATALPDEFRLNGNQGKFLLKRAMEGTLPDEIIYRKKRGFPVPVARWFREDLYERTAAILLDRRATDRRYYRPGYVEGVLRRHRNGQEDLSRRIFSLLTLEMWHQKYVD